MSTEPAVQNDDVTGANSTFALDDQRIAEISIDQREVGASVEDLVARRPTDIAEQGELYLHAISCLDLTSLSGNETAAEIESLCRRARHPIDDPLRRRLAPDLSVPRSVAAICVHANCVATARAALTGATVKIATVAAGFPLGQLPLSARIAEVTNAASSDVDEIDAVIDRRLAVNGDWQSLHDEITAFRIAAGARHLKIILGSGDLPDLTTVARASYVAMCAGADFIKTSTGKEAVNATMPVALTMLRMIALFQERTGVSVGFKPAGGISEPERAGDFVRLVRHELGPDRATPQWFRIGASSLLGNLVDRLTDLHGAVSAPQRG